MAWVWQGIVQVGAIYGNVSDVPDIRCAASLERRMRIPLGNIETERSVFSIDSERNNGKLRPIFACGNGHIGTNRWTGQVRKSLSVSRYLTRLEKWLTIIIQTGWPIHYVVIV